MDQLRNTRSWMVWLRNMRSQTSMTDKEAKRHRGREANSDFLWTADEIARFIKRTPRFVYHQQKNLGLVHIGGTLVGSKSKLTKLLSGEAV
jgi:hypothetical protein